MKPDAARAARPARPARPARALHVEKALAATPEATRLAASVRSVEVVVDGVRAPAGAARLRRFCASALAAAGHRAWDVTVLLCGDDRIRGLNERYRGKPVPTDVLSFPRDEGRKGDPVCGDIAVSLDTLGRNALRFAVSENEEMKRLLVHGLLHLAGMDHGQGRSGKMLALQERLLRRLNSDMIYAGRAVRK